MHVAAFPGAVVEVGATRDAVHDWIINQLVLLFRTTAKFTCLDPTSQMGTRGATAEGRKVFESESAGQAEPATAPRGAARGGPPGERSRYLILRVPNMTLGKRFRRRGQPRPRHPLTRGDLCPFDQEGVATTRDRGTRSSPTTRGATTYGQGRKSRSTSAVATGGA